MKFYNIQKNKGFTLVEMLVSVALFSIVVVIALGSIITIIDTNRKSQSLTLVMNNLNFALESMTRTIKTSTEVVESGGLYRFKKQKDDPDDPHEPDVWVTYKHDDANQTILRCKKGDSGTCSNFIPVISEDVKVEKFDFEVLGNIADEQWRVFMVIEGVAKMSPRVSSKFNVQTTVSPRNLNL